MSQEKAINGWPSLGKMREWAALSGKNGEELQVKPVSCARCRCWRAGCGGFAGSTPFLTAATELMAQLTAQQASVELAVSRLSVLECRVKPLRDGNAALLKRYDDFFAAVQVVELSAAVVDAATQLRARYGLKTPDALQAASAFAVVERTLFVTADAGFAKVTGLDVRLIRVA